MNMPNILPLALGLIIFSFFINSALIVPFIDFLYSKRLVRRKEGEGSGKESLFDKLHDKKAGTPTGGGILLIATTAGIFGLLLPVVLRMGVPVQSSYKLAPELVVVFFTFISFGLLGLVDDLMKIFGKKTVGRFGFFVGMGRKVKFALQWVLGLTVGILLYKVLGIQIIHIPVTDVVINLGVFYVLFAATVVVFFANAFNFTDGLDGLASGLLMIYLFAYIFIAANHLDTPLFIFIGLWLGAIIAFLYFNVWPARVFLGDAGALSFGATIAVIGLLVGNVATLFVIGGLFILEAASSAIQILGWKVLKKPIFPLAPIHHSFLVLGWEEPKIVMRAWLAGVILAIFGLWLATI